MSARNPVNAGADVALTYLVTRLPALMPTARDALGRVLNGDALASEYAGILEPLIATAPWPVRQQLVSMVKGWSPEQFRQLVTTLYQPFDPSPYGRARSLVGSSQVARFPFLNRQGGITLPPAITRYDAAGRVLHQGSAGGWVAVELGDGQFDLMPSQLIVPGSGGDSAGMGRNNGPVAQRSFASSPANLELSAFNGKRRYLMIQNRSTLNPFYIAFGRPATVNVGTLVGPGGNMTLDTFVPTDSINVIAVAASVPGVITEG